MGQVFEAGEVFVRKHPRAFGDSPVPFALELIEPERLVESSCSRCRRRRSPTARW
jgi:hypothetical protein